MRTEAVAQRRDQRNRCHEQHHGDHADTRYVDPAPFLARAKIIDALEALSRVVDGK